MNYFIGLGMMRIDGISDFNKNVVQGLINDGDRDNRVPFWRGHDEFEHDRSMSGVDVLVSRIRSESDPDPQAVRMGRELISSGRLETEKNIRSVAEKLLKLGI